MKLKYFLHFQVTKLVGTRTVIAVVKNPALSKQVTVPVGVEVSFKYCKIRIGLHNDLVFQWFIDTVFGT